MRALLRLGWREAWRHKLRSTMVLVLILVPVGMSAAALTLAPSFWSGADRYATQHLGEAQAVATSTDPSLAWVDTAPWNQPGAAADAAVGPTVVEAARFTGWVPAGDDLVDGLAVEQVAATDPLVVTRFPTVDGRLPERAGEAAVSASVMRRFDVGIGDRLRLAVPQADLTVVGEIVGDGCEDCDGAIIGAGSVERPTTPTEADPFPATWSSVGWSDVRYVGGLSDEAVIAMELASMSGAPEGQPQPAMFLTRASWADSDTDATTVRGWIVAGAAFLLLWTGLVAASGLAVGARRRKRELGLLAANGADPSALRLAVVAEGLVIGAIGAAVGVVLGVVGARIATPRLATTVWDVAQVELPVFWLAVIWVVGTTAAVAASWSASIGVASLTPSQLLRGHRPTPRPAPAWFAVGSAVFVAGCIALRAGQELNRRPGSTPSSVGPVVIALGVLAVSVGLVAIVVGAARIAGRLTGRSPVSVRLAGRDLSRQGIRVAAAAAAIAMTLTGALAIATWDSAGAERRTIEEERARAVGDSRVELGARLQGGSTQVGAVSARASRLTDGRVLPMLPDASVAEALRVAGSEVGTVTRYEVLSDLKVCDRFETVDAAGNTLPDSCGVITPMVVDDAMIQLLPDQVADQLRSGGLVLPSGYGSLRRDDGSQVDAQIVNLSLWTDDSGPVGGFGSSGVLMSSTTADGLGVDRSTARAVEPYVDMEPLDAAAIADVREAASARGYDLQIGSWTPRPDGGSDDIARWARLAGAGVISLVTLLIVLIALALVRVESRSDDEVLLIAGASPGLSRRVSASRAGLIVLGAAIPASVAGLVVAQALMRTKVVVPWSSLALGLVGLPLAAAALAWLLHRPPRRLHLG